MLGSQPQVGAAACTAEPSRYGAINQFIPRSLAILTAICVLAGTSVTVTSSVEAKPRSLAPGTTKLASKNASAVKADRKAMKRKTTTRKTGKRKSFVRSKQVLLTGISRTPADKNECIGAAQTSYTQAQALFRQKKQGIPREFEQVISRVSQLCGEEEFEKARSGMEWINRCLTNVRSGFCSVEKSYLCAIDSKFEGCSDPDNSTEGHNFDGRQLK